LLPARLTYICLRSGRLEEALALAGQAAEYAQQAHAGPWSQIYSEIRKLDVLNEMGKSSQVLTEIDQLRERMQGLPGTRGSDEMVEPWAVREQMLATGREAARRLGQWNDVLEMNAAAIASMRERHAPAASITKAMYNDYQPLLRLDRADDALSVLQHCRPVFEATQDIEMLSRVLAGLADTEDKRGHGDAAIRFAHDALRYAYLAEDIANIVVTYHNLGCCRTSSCLQQRPRASWRGRSANNPIRMEDFNGPYRAGLGRQPADLHAGWPDPPPAVLATAGEAPPAGSGLPDAHRPVQLNRPN
jgi:hypothetical protein